MNDVSSANSSIVEQTRTPNSIITIENNGLNNNEKNNKIYS